MSSIDEKSQQYYASYNQYGNYFYIGRLFDNAGQFDSADSGGFRYCGTPVRKHLRDPRFRIFVNQINLQVIFRQNSNASNCALQQQVMNHLLVFFIIMSCTGKWQFFYKQEVLFSTNMCCKCFGFHGKNAKIKKQGIFICFPET